MDAEKITVAPAAKIIIITAIHFETVLALEMPSMVLPQSNTPTAVSSVYFLLKKK